MSEDAALVTGAAGGIGEALCRALAEAGHRVIGLDTAAPPETFPAGGTWIECDLAQYVSNEALRRQTDERLRHECSGLRVLVNNAAVQRLAGLADLDFRDWQETLDVNVSAPLLLTKACLPPLAQAEDGCVVNIASVHARLTKPGFVSYAASKAALLGLTRALAVDLGSRVRVNAVVPGAIDTPMLRAGFSAQPERLDALIACHPAGRLGTPKDVADAVVFLAARGAQFASGTSLELDGAVGARLHDPV